MLWKEVVLGVVFGEKGVIMGGGCWEDGVMGGGCWGDGVMDNTSELTNIFRSDFWGLFSPLPSLSNLLYLLSQLNVHVYTVSPSSSLAPSDVSSPLVVMATSSSIKATGGGGGGLSSPAGGPQTMIFNMQAPQRLL